MNHFVCCLTAPSSSSISSSFHVEFIVRSFVIAFLLSPLPPISSNSADRLIRLRRLLLTRLGGPWRVRVVGLGSGA
jgi:hypothetical protein